MDSADAAERERSEQLEAAERAREAGNARIRSGDVASARALYEEALQILKREGGRLLIPAGDSDTELDFAGHCRQCLCAVQLNLALCHLKAKPCEGGKALELCEEVLSYDPDNVKACYRKGKALVELGELKEAEWEFSRACKLAPTDRSIRQDLIDLRRSLRDTHRSEQEKAKQAFEGIFDRGVGFASSGREDASSAAAIAGSSAPRTAYRFLTDEAENPFMVEERPAELALALQERGRFERALSAWEAAVRQTLAREEWPEHYAHWLSLGRLFMDLNCDALALRCFDRIAEAAEPSAPLPVRQHSLLLRAICLLNESAQEPIGEVSASLEEWLAGEVAAAAGAGGGEAPEPAACLEARLGSWRRSSPGADAAVAHGLLLLLHQREGALKAFSDAAEAAPAATACFGPQHLASRWNMLGAVCANIKNYKAALVAYGQALALQPRYPRAKSNQGIALYSLGDGLGAVVSYVGALTAVPDWAAEEVWQHLQQVAQLCWEEAGLATAIVDRNLTVLKDFAEKRAVPPFALLEPQEALRLMDLAVPPAKEEVDH